MSSSVNLDVLKNQVITELNKIRTNPKSYITSLNEYISWFDGNILNKPGSEYEIETKEGAEAYKDAIEFLKKQKPQKALVFDEEVTKASQSHADDIGQTNGMSHIGSDGKDNYQRLSEYIDWETFLAECIDFGGTTGKEVIIALLVDDGVPEKDHRLSIFSKEAQNFGVGVAYHNECEICTVIDLVGEIKTYFKNKKKNVINIQKEAIKKMSYLAEESEQKKNISDASKLAKKEKEKELLKSVGKEYEMETDKFSDDSDAPEGAVSCKIKKVRQKKGKDIIEITTKTYTMEDGTQEVITLEENEKDL